MGMSFGYTRAGSDDAESIRTIDRALDLGVSSSTPHRPHPLDARPSRRRLARTNPRFMGENFQRNLRIADEIQAVAAEAGATLAQVAIAWLLRGDDIAPIPGTKRVARVEENTAADGIELTPEHIAKLDNLIPPAGDHHNEAQMRMIDR